MKRQLIAGLASVMMVVPTVGNVQAKSSSTKLMDQFVAAYKKGNYAKAKAANSKMVSVTEEPCAYKMSKAMKKAYKTIVKAYINGTSKDLKSIPASSKGSVNIEEYYLSDVDNDGKAELLIETRDRNYTPSSVYNVYTFKKNKAVHIGKNIETLDGSIYAYPGKKGVYFFAQDHATLDLEKGVIKNGKFKWQRINFGASDSSKAFAKFFKINLGMRLSGHLNDNNFKFDLSIFK